MAVKVITQNNFEQEVLASPVPVLVDFWAAWCGPCKMLAPVVDELAEETDGAFSVGKVNVDEEPALAAQFGVESIPTLMVFENGTLVQTLVGARPKQELLDLMKGRDGRA